MDISRFDAQKKLSALWLINAGILALIFLLFTIFDRFDQQSDKGWEWYSQNIIPVTSLMMGSFYISINDKEREAKVDSFYFKICFGISIFYLAMLYLTLFLAPLAFRFSNLSILDLLDKSKLYLILLQGILTCCLGLFFNKK